MSNSTIYTAITIGPIYDTISLTSSPAGLWAGSYIFSYISRRLCELLAECDEFLEGSTATERAENILSPFYDPCNFIKDGIGRYHDRIVFKPKNDKTILDDMNRLFKKVTEEIAEAFGDTLEWFTQYLQLHAICFESGGKDGNPILDCSQYLDALELEKTFPTCDIENPLKSLYESSDKNIQIREKIRDKLSFEEWPFRDKVRRDENGKEQMPYMEDITGRQSETEKIEDEKKNNIAISERQKINSYYAIVQSDGDRFGDYIKNTCKDLKNIREFSKKCLSFCSDAADEIQSYGGVTIYAGGDDLLFITSLQSQKASSDRETENLLDLLDRLKCIFGKHFGTSEGSPTLSFGVAIRYYKYPLYEAFSEAYQLLGEAKRNRNSAAISLQKRSGQSLEFVLEKFTNNNITQKLRELMSLNMNEDMLKSISSKIWEFKSLFNQALSLDNKSLKNVFDNTFDDDVIHTAKASDIDAVRELLELIISETGKNELRLLLSDSKELELKKLDILLRFAKFWGEKGEESHV